MDPVELASSYLQQVLLESLDWPADRAWAHVLRRLDSIAAVHASDDDSTPRMRAVHVARRAIEQELATITRDPDAASIEDADRTNLSQAVSAAINRLTEEVGRLRAARPTP